MSPSVKDKIVGGLIGGLFTFGISVAMFAMSRHTVKVDFDRDQLMKKADVTYVDSRDDEIKSDIKDFKMQQEQRHTFDMQQTDKKFDQVDKKLDLIIKLIEK